MKYSKPEIEVITFEEKDVITASGIDTNEKEDQLPLIPRV